MKSYEELKKFIKFNIVGVINTLVDLLAYTLLTYLGMSILPAQAISYVLGAANSYILNSGWTFKNKSFSWVKLLLFVMVTLLGYGLSVAILFFLKRHWRLAGFFAKLIALPFTIVFNFAGMRLFVFKAEKK